MRYPTNYLFIAITVLMILLSSCETSVSNNKPYEQVNTWNPQEQETVIAVKTEFAKTNEARAKTTPQILPTRSNFEKCEQSGGVKYVITGTSSVSVTQQNDIGGTDQGDYKVPYCVSFNGFKTGDFLYISAQMLGSGNITCKIYDGAVVIAQASASGEYSIATCSASK